MTSYQIDAEKKKLKEVSRPRLYDKNFLSLNKIAAKRHISTSRGQTNLRTQIGSQVRIIDPAA